MSRFTENEQYSLDLEWFALDSEGNIGSFLSGGLLLPESVASDKESLLMVLSYMSRLPCERSEVILNPDLNRYTGYMSMDKKNTYDRVFGSTVRKGIFAFNRDEMTVALRGYFCVAKPTKVLSVSDVPDAVRLVLERTVYSKGSFLSLPFVHECDIG